MFAGGFMVLALIQPAVAYREGQRNRLAVADITATMQQMMSGSELSSTESDDKKYGEMAPMVKIVTDYAKDMQSDMLAMNKEMEDLQLEANRLYCLNKSPHATVAVATVNWSPLIRDFGAPRFEQINPYHQELSEWQNPSKYSSPTRTKMKDYAINWRIT